ncbi:MAG: Rpn family recombination-promoting nuclease/putative transposase [Chloroherpetonaceae bacterium]|nr:Rpn family recombination-promoting nuclease/putative transposase [Chloroherpetonaceae bacterium]MDW8437826.1 Rpn family recombination-promoting nuclease/putative transposase [Chloroherpetonaceae bacterium]
MKTDKLVYLLFKRLPQGFFALIGRNPNDAERYLFKSVEIKETAFRLDAVFLPKDDDETYFVEAQFQPDDAFYARFFAEIFLFLRQYPTKKWRAVVIYPTKAIESRESDAYSVLLESAQVRRVYLDELPADAKGAIGAFRLLIEPESTAPALARNLASEGKDILDVVQQILFYKFKTKSRKEIMKMLGVEEEILRETKAFQEILEEGREEMLTKTVPILRELGLKDEDIARKLEVPVEKVKAIAPCKENSV